MPNYTMPDLKLWSSFWAIVVIVSSFAVSGLIMNIASIAYENWSSGKALEAGRLIYEQLPIEMRPFWAAAILNESRKLIHRVPEIDEIYTIAMDKSRWAEAYEAFWSVRALTLQIEKESATAPLYKAVLDVSENVAKVIYNAFSGPAPFDDNAGWRLVSCFRQVVDLVNNLDFEQRAWLHVIGES